MNNKKFFVLTENFHNYLIYLNFLFHFFHCRLKREDGQITIIQTMAQPQQNTLQQQNIQQPVLDHDEKKMRRQIANSNERRRMQSINAGFQSLRQLLPHHEGEKLSKVSHSFHFIYFNLCVKSKTVTMTAVLDCFFSKNQSDFSLSWKTSFE